MKSNMTEEDLRRWALAEVLVRQGYGQAATPEVVIAKAEAFVNYIRNGVPKD